MSLMINVSIFTPRNINRKNPETCTIDEFQVCEIFRKNAIDTKNKNLAPCLKCKKYEELKRNFETRYDKAICEICGKEYFLINHKRKRLLCDDCRRKKNNKKTPTRYHDAGHRHKKNIAKSCVCIETGENFTSTIAAAEYYDLSPSDISRSARTGKTVGGFTWKYI